MSTLIWTKVNASEVMTRLHYTCVLSVKVYLTFDQPGLSRRHWFCQSNFVAVIWETFCNLHRLHRRKRGKVNAFIAVQKTVGFLCLYNLRTFHSNLISLTINLCFFSDQRKYGQLRTYVVTLEKLSCAIFCL